MGAGRGAFMGADGRKGQVSRASKAPGGHVGMWKWEVFEIHLDVPEACFLFVCFFMTSSLSLLFVCLRLCPREEKSHFS